MPSKIVPLVTIIAMLFCGLMSASASPRQKTPTDRKSNSAQTKTARAALKAVYFVGDKGVLVPDDLRIHPEVRVVHTMEELKRIACAPIAIWIDKGVVNDVNRDGLWLHQAPQKDYPIVLVGYNDALYSFRAQLEGFGLHGPYVDWNREKLEPGFSVWDMREVRKHLADGVTEISHFGLMKGFAQEVTVQSILEVTDPLLKNPPKAPDVQGAGRPRAHPVPLQAVYLVGNRGELEPADLKAHPEVAVVHTWADFQTTTAQQNVALWIDKNAVSLIKTGEADVWLHQEPQKWRPIVLVGYNDDLYAFREALPYFGIEGPPVDWSLRKVEPGFSLWKMQDETPTSRSATLHGFKIKPSVKSILRLTAVWLSAHNSQTR